MNVAIENVINSRFGQEASINTNDGFSIDRRKGTLNWPVKSGIISSKYGIQPHPTLKNITLSNNGIDIRAQKGSEALAVASGKVVGVTDLAGYGKMIILKHSQYFTVYSKLENVYVQNGDSVEEGTKLGTLSLKNGVSELHFEIWNNNKTENPEKWLK
jgi:murein DD-endopeptidase MepM/ murein hydrolase activator NlpD